MSIINVMTTWDTYPNDYRATEVAFITTAARAGECVSVVGLSGAGKSNLLGFIANRVSLPGRRFVLIDCNRLSQPTPSTMFRLVRRALGDSGEAADELEALDSALDRFISASGGPTLLLDRFDVFTHDPDPALFNNLRALRDRHKFELTFLASTRRPLPPDNEFAELFHANTLWLGPLNQNDSRWNVARYAERKSLHWDETVVEALFNVSRGYASFLRAACESYAAGANVGNIASHPAVRARVEEFWSDKPTDDELRLSGLSGHPFLTAARPSGFAFDTTQLTAKEHLLLNYFLAHPETVCEKDDLIHAAWPEDKVFERGVRDDSLSQLIRRLREKIEPDPATPRHIFTVPGRGYRFKSS
ncbi:MAG: winged helix-turn-helix domain-containing protein [Chloroflexi bacterium]|nr:winged helix-turn-helix domain-containing protein [Chloroflexota bacterium]